MATCECQDPNLTALVRIVGTNEKPIGIYHCVGCNNEIRKALSKSCETKEENLPIQQ